MFAKLLRLQPGVRDQATLQRVGQLPDTESPGDALFLVDGLAYAALECRRPNENVLCRSPSLRLRSVFTQFVSPGLPWNEAVGDRSLLRSLFAVLALSGQKICKGMAIGLGARADHVWCLFFVVDTRKLVGLELV